MKACYIWTVAIKMNFEELYIINAKRNKRAKFSEGKWFPRKLSNCDLIGVGGPALPCTDSNAKEWRS
ncbi:hypothetical protein M5689_018148 [Euphorbia peplus]|nr:hypothetical protein M5689_018148 [Euphorbia peplus]